MPGAAYMSAAKVSAQLQAGTITQAQIDAAVLRMLVPMFAVGLFDAPPGRSEPSAVSTPNEPSCSESSRIVASFVANLLAIWTDNLACSDQLQRVEARGERLHAGAHRHHQAVRPSD